MIAEAQKALADGQPRLVALDPDPESRRRPGLTVFPMTCHSGGSVEIHIQPVLPPPRLLIYGVSPTARALVRLGKAMGYAVLVIDPERRGGRLSRGRRRAEGSGRGRRARGRRGDSRASSSWRRRGSGTKRRRPRRWRCEPPPAYLGVMASGKRFGEMRALLGDSVGAGAFARVKNPAGLDLGATLPEEIALSILAEIVGQRHAATMNATADATPMPRSRPPPPPRRRPSGPGRRAQRRARRAPAGGEARDPVCGMTVTVAGAAHRAEHDGRAFYFCCGGCRARFLAAPAQFLGAEATT